jgi:hypothetical protein
MTVFSIQARIDHFLGQCRMETGHRDIMLKRRLVEGKEVRLGVFAWLLHRFAPSLLTDLSLLIDLVLPIPVPFAKCFSNMFALEILNTYCE